MGKTNNPDVSAGLDQRIMTDSKLDRRVKMRESATKRMNQLEFGDPVTNVCASEDNPMFHCYFVEFKRNARNARCTDRKGNFWDIDTLVIYQGHLSKKAAEELFDPIHKALF